VKHFDAGLAQLLTNPRGKIHRINSDGTITTDNPFGENVNSVWAVWNHRA
jgi:glucose/arabinose dehydrogenase